MKNIFKLAIDIGHNVNFDGGAVGIKKENVLNYEVGTKLIEKCRAGGINVINCTQYAATIIKIQYFYIKIWHIFVLIV